MLKHGIPSEDVASCSVHLNTNDTLDLTTPESLNFTAPEPESYQQQNDSEIASPLTDGSFMHPKVLFLLFVLPFPEQLLVLSGQH